MKVAPPIGVIFLKAATLVKQYTNNDPLKTTIPNRNREFIIVNHLSGFLQEYKVVNKIVKR